MKYPFVLLSAIALAGCSDPEFLPKPQLPPLTDGAGYSAPGSPVVSGPQAVTLGANAYQLNQLTGPIDLNDVPVCDAVRLVLTDSLGAQSSCTASGNVWFQTGRDVSSAEAFRAFVLVLQRAGATVATSGGVVSVSGQVGDAGGMAAVGAVDSPLADGLGGGAYRYTGDIPEVSRVAGQMIRTSVGAAVITSVPGTADHAEVFRNVALESGYTVSAYSDGQRVFLAGPANEVELVRAAAFADREKTVPLRVGAVDETTVAALQEAFPLLTISHDPQRSVLYVRGFGDDLEDAMPALRVHISEPQQVRLDAAFVEWSSRSETSFATALEGIDGRYGVSLGSVVEGGSVTVTGGLSATLSAIEALGSTSVLATPSLTVLDGRAARFVSGDQVPFITQSEDQDGNIVQSVEYRDTGVVLNVTAAHATDGTVRIAARIEVTGVREGEGVLGNPIFSTRLVDTSVRVTSGQSVVISGLTMDRASRSSSGLPGASRVGILGQNKRGSDRSELLFVVTPRLLGASGSALRSAK